MSYLSDYQNSNVPKFSKGESVIFNNYGKNLKCVVREVNVNSHKFNSDDVIYYRIEGEAESICTARFLRKAA